MSITFRFAEISDYDRISQFLAQYWAENHVYTRDRGLFDWTFGRRSHWKHHGYSFALAEANGELVGTLGGIPFTFNNRGQRSQGVWIANYALRPDCRKGTTAFKLLDTFRGEPYDLTVACGLNPETTVIYRVLRGRVLAPMARHMATMRGSEARMAELLALAHPGWEPDRVARLSEAFALDKDPAPVSDWSACIPDSWDAANWSKVAQATVGAARDAEYLKWRYVDHPTFDYKILALEDGARTGLIVWRLESIHVQDECGMRPFDEFIRVVEFLPASRENARRLLSALTLVAEDLDVLGMDFFGYDATSRKCLSEFGMRAVDTVSDGRLIPTRFQPLDSKTTEAHNAMFASEGTPECVPDDDCCWYWTKSDSDQDRPN